MIGRMPVAYSLQRNRRTCKKTCINVDYLLSCRTQDAAEEPSTYCFQKALETKRDSFSRDEGAVKSLNRLLIFPGLFFGTVILFRGYTRKTPLNYPLYALHYQGRFSFVGFPLRRPHPHSGALTSSSVISGTRLSSR